MFAAEDPMNRNENDLRQVAGGGKERELSYE
jgi:hypothetical protein